MTNSRVKLHNYSLTLSLYAHFRALLYPLRFIGFREELALSLVLLEQCSIHERIAKYDWKGIKKKVV